MILQFLYSYHIMLFQWKTSAGKCIYRSSDALSIYQNPLYRWMTFNHQKNTIQSLINRRNPQKPELAYLLPFTYAVRTNPGKSCLLGLGGAAVAHYLAPYLRHHSLTAIESNAHVITAASEYFMTSTLENLSIIHQDAQNFVLQTQQSYQHMLIDIYAADGYPAQCGHPEFFAACKHILLPEGVLTLNIAHFQKEWLVLEHLRTVFNQATLCIPITSCSNMIVLASHSASTLVALAEQHPQLKKLIWDRQFGYMAELQTRFKLFANS